MHSRTVVSRVALTSVALWLVGCGSSEFPTTPTPVVTGAVTTLGGGSWSGDVLLGDGALTSFNMTLIARSLGQEAGVQPSAFRVRATTAQTAGTTEVSGNFQTGTGVTGTVQGQLQGTLKDGSFEGTLSSPSCSRSYSGPITESTVAWIARGSAPPGCALTFSIQLPRPRGPGCQYVVSFSQQTFSGNGGSGSVNINTGLECAWAAESLDPWLSVDDVEPRLGPGRVTFSVAPNSQSSREGRLRVAVANQTFLVNQGPACAYSVSLAAIAAGGAGGSGTIAVNTATGCEWTAQSAAPWISANPDQGAGSGTVSYAIQANVGTARTGTLQVAGQTITVRQDASCGGTVTPTSVLFGASGGSDAVNVNAPEGCAWTAASQDSWIVLGSRSGTGPARLSFTVPANTGPQRTGSFTAAGQRVTISQSSGCKFTLSAESTIEGPGLLTNVMRSSGDRGTVTVDASDPTCQWTLSGNDSWIRFNNQPSVSDTGTLTLTYQVDANSGSPTADPIERTGTVTLSGDGADTPTGDGAVTITVTFRQIPG